MFSSLKHDNIVKYYGYVHLSDPKVVGPVTEVVSTIKDLNPTHIVKFLTDVANGLEYIETEGVIHRNICPDTVFVCTPIQRQTKSFKVVNGVAKIADFSQSKYTHNSEQALYNGSSCSVPKYVASEFTAPEVKNGKIQTSKADIYSYGKLVEHLIDIHGDQLSDSVQEYLKHISTLCTKKLPSNRMDFKLLKKSLDSIEKLKNNKRKSEEGVIVKKESPAKKSAILESSNPTERIPSQKYVQIIEQSLPQLKVSIFRFPPDYYYRSL